MTKKINGMRLFPGCLFIATLALFSGCKSVPHVYESLPRETEVPGWKTEGRNFVFQGDKVKSFDRSSFDSGAVEIAGGKYMPLSDSAASIHVLIYRFASSMDAFSVFSVEKGFEHEQKENSCSHFIAGDSLSFRMGEYYVKIIKEGAVKNETLEHFKTVISSNLERSASAEALPSYSTLFSDSRDPATACRDLMYYKNGHKVIPGSRRVYVRKKIILNKEKFVYFIMMNSPEDASAAYYTILKSSEPGFTISKSGVIQHAFRAYDGQFVFITSCKELIFGVLNADTINEGGTIISNLNVQAEIFFRKGSSKN